MKSSLLPTTFLVLGLLLGLAWNQLAPAPAPVHAQPAVPRTVYEYATYTVGTKERTGQPISYQWRDSKLAITASTRNELYEKLTGQKADVTSVAFHNWAGSQGWCMILRDLRTRIGDDKETEYWKQYIFRRP